MSRGKRYEEPKLNIKKVIAVIVAILVIIMFGIMINGILQKEKNTNTGSISSLSYFPIFKDNKWGVVDSNAKVVIEPSYHEMIIVPNNKHDIFLCTYDVNYETGEYKTKVLNSKNEMILTQYDKVEAISNQDVNNNLWYEEFLKVQKNGKYGMIQLDGKEVLPAEYEKIEAVQGIKNAILVQKDGKYGVVDKDGKAMTDIAYTEIKALGKDNKSGYIVKNEQGKFGIIDFSKKQILPNQYDGIEKIYGNDLYVVIVDGKQKLVKKDGTDVLTEGFEKIEGILKTNGAGIIYQNAGKFGVMDLTGKVVVEPIYESLKEAKQGILIASKDGKFGVIDMALQEKLPFQYQSVTYQEPADIYVAEDAEFQANILNSNFEVKQSGILIQMDIDKGYFELKQGDDYKYYNFKFEEIPQKEILINNTLFVSKKDGKYGFVDKDGKVVVDYVYDDATNQNSYGFAGVKKDGKWGSIDRKGNVVIQPTYNLDSYLLVDFIGGWHLGQDVNMNYYNQL